MLLGINRHVSDAYRCTGIKHLTARARASTQRGANASNKFTNAVGLYDVVVGANLKTNDGVDLGSFCRHHDDWHLALFANLATDIGSRNFGQHDVEQHNVRIELVEVRQCLGTIPGDFNSEPLSL